MELGPSQGEVHVHTAVAGAGARLGHALDIAVDDWRMQVTFAKGAVQFVVFSAVLDSMRVVEGHGGVKPLSEGDRRTIRDNALRTLAATRHPEVRFASTAITASHDRLVVSGELTIHGRSVATVAEVHLDRGAASVRATCRVPVVQTRFGITPYSAMLGQLKVADEVAVTVDVVAPLGSERR